MRVHLQVVSDTFDFRANPTLRSDHFVPSAAELQHGRNEKCSYIVLFVWVGCNVTNNVFMKQYLMDLNLFQANKVK